jgi:hypothetical protein
MDDENLEFYRANLKFKRNTLLNETDKFLMPDFPITAEKLEIIKAYRQALRDFTTNDFKLPKKPDFISLLND